MDPMRRGKGGPRSAAGKRNASRNALRHGLTAVTHRRAFASIDLKNIADALCDGEKADPDLMAAALEVAECEMALRAVRAQARAVVERLSEPTAIALRKGDNGLTIGRAKYLGIWILGREIETLVPKLMEKYKDQMPPSPKVAEKEERERQTANSDDGANRSDGNNTSIRHEDGEGLVPYRLKALLETNGSIEVREHALGLAKREIEVRDGDEALEEATPDLLRLARYEQRAWCRLLRAIRKFANRKFVLALGDHPLN
jgi:hypothetical protein